MKCNNPNFEKQTAEQDIGLWERIHQFEIDDPNSSFPFSHKLAKEQNWNSAFTLQAIEEYKRFVYLCCIAPQGASPPHIVDEVWHLHLQYTRNYWDEFCDKVLHRKLHHEPSTGGQVTTKKHKDWRQDTLQLYQQIFNTSPPADIWMDTPRRKANWQSYLSHKFRLLLLIVVISTTTGCENAGLNLLVIGILTIIFGVPGKFSNESESNNVNPNKNKKADGSCGSGGCGSSNSSSCGSSCGSSGCGGGCGGCGS